MRSFVALVTVALASNAAARTFTVFNQCPFTIWCVQISLCRNYYSRRPSQARCTCARASGSHGYPTGVLISFQIFTDHNVGSSIPNQPTGYAYIHPIIFLRH